MITTLEKVKERLGITDALSDALLTSMIVGVAARFDQETGRTLGRTVGFTQEFGAVQMDIALQCYPVEVVSKFELKSNQAVGWVEKTDVEYLLRVNGAVLSLPSPLGAAPQVARVTYTGGYVMPPDVAGAGQTGLPQLLQSAAIEQVAMWYQTRAHSGVYRMEDTGGTYLELGDRMWVPWVRRVLGRYRRLVVG